MKRDDLTGAGLGGNKVRKLEFLLGEARAQGADHIVTQGAVQSNHVRQTAAMAAKLGLRCTALLEHRIETNDNDYLQQRQRAARPAARLRDRIPARAAPTCRRRSRRRGEKLRARRRRSPMSSRAAARIAWARSAMPRSRSNCSPRPTSRGCASTGSCMRRAAPARRRGLVAGLTALNADIRVLGIGVRAPKDRQEANVHKLAAETAEYHGRERRRAARGGGGELRLCRHRATAIRRRG